MSRVDRRFTSGIYRWGEVASGSEGKPSQKAIDDRDRRSALGETRDTTGQMLGDPPAGRSALDRKRDREAAERIARLAMGEGQDG